MFEGDIEQLVIHSVCLRPALLDGVGGAMLQVVAKELAGDGAQGLLHGGDLHEDVGAVTVALHHLLQASYLALNAAQALQVPRLGARLDGDSFSLVYHVLIVYPPSL